LALIFQRVYGCLYLTDTKFFVSDEGVRVLQPRALPLSSCANAIPEDRLYPLNLPHVLFLPLLHLLHLPLVPVPALLSSARLPLPPLLNHRAHHLATAGVLELMIQVLEQDQVVLELPGQAVVKQEEAGAMSA